MKSDDRKHARSLFLNDDDDDKPGAVPVPASGGREERGAPKQFGLISCDDDCRKLGSWRSGVALSSLGRPRITYVEIR